VLGVALILTLGDAAAALRGVDSEARGLAVDALARFLNAVVLASAGMTVLISVQYLSDLQNQRGEYYALLLASVLGMMLLTSAVDLLMLFLAVELMSIPIYALAGYQRTSLRSNESALKYFIIGSFASAVLLYGCALLYGATGSIRLRDVAFAFNPEEPVALVGAGLLLVGLAFKVGSVPFHQWVPDVYEGAPTTITAFMATGVKAAAFGALVRVMSVAFEANQELFYWPLWWLAVASMTVGNLMALVQQSTKRMLAYSSIAHAGYLLVGVCVGTPQGYAAVLFYLLVYTFMTIAAFTVVAVVSSAQRGRDQIDELAGLSVARPFLAAVMALAMLSLAGIPPTGGFVGKFQLFSAAIERGNAIGDSSLIWLAILGVLNSALSLGYYLRLPVVMYMREPRGELPAHIGSGAFGSLVLGLCALAIVLLGLGLADPSVALGESGVLAAAARAALSLP
jgi:NADH-quinone oxidoreductase subunit N